MEEVAVGALGAGGVGVWARVAVGKVCALLAGVRLVVAPVQVSVIFVCLMCIMYLVYGLGKGSRNVEVNCNLMSSIVKCIFFTLH